MARTTIPAELVAINAIQGTLIADNAITAVHIATNAVSGTLVADNAITSTHIAQNQVTATQIAQNTITVGQIADSAVETAKLNNDAVTQAKIADDAVGADQLAANSVVSASIVNGTIVEADMADNAVTLAKMASLARGKIIVGDSAGDPSALAIGSNGTVLTSDGTDVSWAASSGGLATSGGTLTGNLTMGGMILKPSADGGSIGFNRNPDSGAHVGDSSLRRFQINGPDSTGGDSLIIQSYNSSGTSQGNLNFQDGNLTFGDDQHLYLGDATSDLDIYHIAGSVSVIRATPAMVLQSDDYISLGTYSDGELMLKATKNGSTDLYYDNLVKLQTTDKGCLVQSSGSKDVTIGMSNGGVDWHIGIDDSAGDHFKLGKHSGMGNNCVYSVTPAYFHRFEGAHQGDSVGTWVFDNENLGDSSTTNCTLMVKNGNAQVQIMPWSSLGARIGTRGGGWSTNSNNAVHLTSNDTGNIILNTNGSPTLANGTAISSDERLKKNITDIASGQLAKINALKPRSFEWKDSRKPGAQEGFIAQEVESVMAEAVEDRLCSPDPDDTSRDFEGDIKVLKHEVINARLIKAVQELSAELDAAKARISALEG
jgi:hypothetical protein